jgi:hypothetical protein
LILQGIPPYQLACNMKLPGTYYAYALGLAVFGQTTTGIHLTLIVANSLIIIFVFLLGRALFGTTAGLAAGMSYAVMSASSSVLGLAAHANFFVLLFAVPATLLLWRVLADPDGKTLFLCGLLYGLALLMKQQGGCFGLFGWTVFILGQGGGGAFHCSVPGPLRPWAGVARGSLILGLGLVLPLAVTVIYFSAVGVFPKFWFWTVTYARVYATATPLLLGLGELGKHLKATIGLSLGLWLLAGWGMARGRGEAGFRKASLFVGGFWLFSFLATP